MRCCILCSVLLYQLAAVKTHLRIQSVSLDPCSLHASLLSPPPPPQSPPSLTPCLPLSLSHGQVVDSSQLRFVRAIKPLRWFKVARIIKLAKGGGVITVFMDSWNISPKQV
jgi:hypothetical protein